MTKEEINEALKSDDWELRKKAVLDSNATKEHLDIGIKDTSISLRIAVIRSPNSTKEHFYIGLQDYFLLVRKCTVSRIKEKVPQSIINKYFDSIYGEFIGTDEDWDSICLLYL